MTPAVPLPCPAKKPCATGAQALHVIAEEFLDFNDSFWSATTGLSQHSNVEATPVWKHKAIVYAQDVEMDLSDNQLVSLIGIFESNVSAADSYLALKHNTLQKAWVSNKLSS